jgi:demethylmenaquinone methyltransferase/2-methoxy-6-polyprenyl-1,4-benzoquinol methylase
MPDHFSLAAPFYEKVIGGFLDPAMLCAYADLPTSGRLLDAGGGTGRVAQALRGMAGQIVVSDVSAGMLRQAAGKDGLLAVRAQAEHLPFADATFDRIIVVDAFHHFADHKAAIADLWRVLAPGGRLVIEEPNIDVAVVKFVAFFERAALMQSRFFSPRDMGQMLQAAGAQVQTHTDHAFNAWVVAHKVAP